MKTSADTNRFLLWAPRILAIVFSLFLSIFAADVFESHAGFWSLALALFMHLLPVLLMLLVLIVSWRYEWVGAIVYSLLGVVYIIWAWGRFPLSVYFFIAGPLFIIAILFFLSWRRRKSIFNNEEVLN